MISYNDFFDFGSTTLYSVYVYDKHIYLGLSFYTGDNTALIKNTLKSLCLRTCGGNRSISDLFICLCHLCPTGICLDT